jgi:hypothetical protein
MRSRAPVVLFESLTVEQVQTAILAGETACITYSDYFENVKRIFGYIEFLMNLCGNDERKLAHVAKQCLRLIAVEPTMDKIDYLIVNNNSLNKNLSVPNIFEDYFFLLMKIKKNGGKVINIVKLVLEHVKKLEDIRNEDLSFILRALLEAADENDDAYKLIFETLAEHAKVRPQYALSKFVAKANEETIYSKYISLLNIFIEKQFDKETILRLFHHIDGTKQKVFYHRLKSSYVDLTNRCDRQLTKVMIDKIRNYPLTPEESYLLAHKEKITVYILDMPLEDRQQTIKDIFENLDSPLSKYFYTARLFTSPSIKRGELKKLAALYYPSVPSLSISNTATAGGHQANSIFSPVKKNATTTEKPGHIIDPSLQARL